MTLETESKTELGIARIMADLPQEAIISEIENYHRVCERLAWYFHSKDRQQEGVSRKMLASFNRDVNTLDTDTELNRQGW